MYYSGDTATLCYNLSPANIPFRLRLTQTAPYQGTPLVWDDNGAGGGDCVTLQIGPNDIPAITAVLQAFVNNQLVGTVTLSAKVPD